jgi:hypothetical protein
MIDKECDYCNETRKVDIYKAHHHVGERYLCDCCKDSNKNSKIKCDNKNCDFETSFETLFMKDDKFNAYNQSYVCNSCSTYE